MPFTTSHRTVVTVALIGGATFILFGLLYLGGKAIEVRPPARPTVAGYGEGRVTAKPDTADITLGVQTGRQPSAEQAMTSLTQQMNAVLAQIKELGIDDKDVSTTNLSLYPAYDWVNGEQVSKGFEASENVVVTLHDIAKVGQTITSATKAGANQVNGIRFYIRDITALRTKARQLAIQNAKQDAMQFATDMHVQLGALAQINETISTPSARTTTFAEGTGGAGGGEVPTPSGEQELVAAVTLTYDAR